MVSGCKLSWLKLLSIDENDWVDRTDGSSL
jgi:hypothetical protein